MPIDWKINMSSTRYGIPSLTRYDIPHFDLTRYDIPHSIYIFVMAAKNWIFMAKKWVQISAKKGLQFFSKIQNFFCQK